MEDPFKEAKCGYIYLVLEITSLTMANTVPRLRGEQVFNHLIPVRDRLLGTLQPGLRQRRLLLRNRAPAHRRDSA